MHCTVKVQQRINCTVIELRPARAITIKLFARKVGLSFPRLRLDALTVLAPLRPFLHTAQCSSLLSMPQDKQRLSRSSG